MDVLELFTARIAVRKVGTKKDIHRRILTRARRHKCKMSERAQLEQQSSFIRERSM